MTEAGIAPRSPAPTLPEMLRRNALERPHDTAIIDGSLHLSFAELLARAETMASMLRERGVERGTRVGLLQCNRAGFLECVFGIVLAGGVVVPFSTWSTVTELGFLLADSEVSLVLAHPAFNGRDLKADLFAACEKAGLDGLAGRIVVSDGNGSFINGEASAPGPAPNELFDGDDDAFILYTSGSTSRPKGVRLTHFGCCTNGFNIGERQGLRPGDRVFLSVPLFWSYGCVNALPAAFGHGAALVLAEKFDPETALEIIRKNRCTSIYTLPAMTNALLNSPLFDKSALASLRAGMTIGTAADLRNAAIGLGIPEICNIYGATETYGNCCVTWHHWPLEKRLDCQGPPLEGQILRMRDPETGAIVARGEVGLVEVSGMVSPGYIGASAEQNQHAFTPDGYYRTGDLGLIDSEGNFHFVGRDSEMIKRAGINVSPSEVELALDDLPDVAQCCVVGVPDERRSELIVAFVVPAANHRPSARAIIDQLRTVLSKYKLPDHVFFRDALPLTATGKLQRKAVKEEASQLVAQLQSEVAQ